MNNQKTSTETSNETSNKDNGIKVVDSQENPIDRVLYKGVKLLAPIFYQFGITPNMITGLSIICSALAVYYLWKRQGVVAAIFYFLNYFFDCCDGYVARKYNQVSKFGDYLDHISDIVGFGLIMAILIYRKRWKVVSVVLFFLIMSWIHISCQEHMYQKKSESPVLSLLSIFNACKTNPKNIYWTRFFGTGTLNLIVALVLLRET